MNIIIPSLKKDSSANYQDHVLMNEITFQVTNGLQNTCKD